MHYEMQWYFIIVIFGFLPYPLQIYLQETRSFFYLLFGFIAN